MNEFLSMLFLDNKSRKKSLGWFGNLYKAWTRIFWSIFLICNVMKCYYGFKDIFQFSLNVEVLIEIIVLSNTERLTIMLSPIIFRNLVLDAEYWCLNEFSFVRGI